MYFLYYKGNLLANNVPEYIGCITMTEASLGLEFGKESCEQIPSLLFMLYKTNRRLARKTKGHVNVHHFVNMERPKS
jgi:2-keto-3-deoxy-6-phosphogluconate aldolase